jgi:DNA-binding winged helix-turn-helix (wHTH) protein/Tol biopolymer transport system component
MKEPRRTEQIVRFGVFEVDLCSGDLRKAGRRIRLQDQPFKVLAALLEQRGQLVTREELRGRIWPEESFGDFDHAVHIAIGKLRNALGDSAEAPRFIETLPRRGYRFIGDIDVLPKAKDEAENIPLLKSTRFRWLVATTATMLAIGLTVSGTLFFSRKAHPLTDKPAPTIPLVQRQLTARTSDQPLFSVAISRDGKYVAHQDKDGISIQDIENGDSHRLPGTAGLIIQDWYPDNLHVLTSDGENLWLILVVSGEKRRLASKASKGSVSLDGSQILFTRDPLATELWIMPSTGGEPRLLLGADKRDEIFTGYSWSPDGKSVAYIRTQRGPSPCPCSLETRILSDGTTRALLSDEALATGDGISVLNWLPDGRLLFVLFKGKTNDLWTLSLDTSGAPAGEPVRLTNTTGVEPSSLSVSADGKHLAVLYRRDTLALFIANLARSGSKLEQPLRLTNDSWNNFPMAWTPDGQTLFYGSERPNMNLFKRSLSSSSAELFAGGAVDYWDARVSPDGQWVMALAKDPKIMSTDRGGPPEGDRQLLRFPISGGNPETILITVLHPARIDCARSGSRICLLSEFSGKQMTLSIVDPIRGRLEEVAKVDTRDDTWWALSPDGSKIVLVEYVSDSLRILDLQSKHIEVIRPRRLMDLQGKPIELVHPTPSQIGLQIPVWSADGRRLFISALPNATKGTLLEMDLTGNTQILAENPYGWVALPVASPDGKRLAYSSIVQESNITLLEHF